MEFPILVFTIYLIFVYLILTYKEKEIDIYPTTILSRLEVASKYPFQYGSFLLKKLNN